MTDTFSWSSIAYTAVLTFFPVLTALVAMMIRKLDQMHVMINSEKAERERVITTLSSQLTAAAQTIAERSGHPPVRIEDMPTMSPKQKDEETS